MEIRRLATVAFAAVLGLLEAFLLQIVILSMWVDAEGSRSDIVGIVFWAGALIAMLTCGWLAWKWLYGAGPPLWLRPVPVAVAFLLLHGVLFSAGIARSWSSGSSGEDVGVALTIYGPVALGLGMLWGVAVAAHKNRAGKVKSGATQS